MHLPYNLPPNNQPDTFPLQNKVLTANTVFLITIFYVSSYASLRHVLHYMKLLLTHFQ